MKKIFLALFTAAGLLFGGCSEETTWVIPAGEATISTEEAILHPGESVALTISVIPEESTETNVIWSSADKSVATVDGSGLVTAISYGETVVTALVDDITAMCRIMVEPRVYLGGSLDGHATLWKNGQIFWQDKGINNSIVMGGMTIVGEDIYLPVRIFDSEKVRNQAWIFKNGIGTKLSDETSEAYSITVKGEDIYATGVIMPDGEFNYRPVVWKNGTAEFLATSGYASDMMLDEFGNVWVVGQELNPSPEIWATARLWKNGEVQTLETQGDLSNASCVLVSGNDVYVGGTTYDKEGMLCAVIWKNGKIHWTLQRGEQTSVADICLAANGDILAIGSKFVSPDPSNPMKSVSVAMMWQNGVAKELSTPDRNAGVYSICTFGENIYMAGSREKVPGVSNLNEVLLWKNGELKKVDAPDWISGDGMTVCVVE